jgi:NADP-dependent 3-hydroxy acid dehydrogenase YdfG
MNAMMLAQGAAEVLRLARSAERLAELEQAVRWEIAWTEDTDTAERLATALDDIRKGDQL